MTLSRQQGLQIAQRFRRALKQRGVPAIAVYVFGSVATGRVKEGSDIDIAVVIPPYRGNAADEGAEIFSIACDIDPHIETVCLRPEDMQNKYSPLVQEVRRDGVAVTAE